MRPALSSVRVLQVGALTGEPGFGQRLVESLQALHVFELTHDPLNADAVLEAHGEADGDGFVGRLVIRARDGRVLWRRETRRPYGVSGPMAYEQLLAELLAACRPLSERAA
ncbi:hypothetical protein [Kallotenue papyrolyticum]|uniref:hypothetical protein n=1 Tax=Kallotenue papyrolyticum TaxID=1325125 RepID=UPI0004922645|nr:hypothetical protein [Kallotenue papyrolyticum]